MSGVLSRKTPALSATVATVASATRSSATISSATIPGYHMRHMRLQGTCEAASSATTFAATRPRRDMERRRHRRRLDATPRQTQGCSCWLLGCCWLLRLLLGWLGLGRRLAGGLPPPARAGLPLWRRLRPLTQPHCRRRRRFDSAVLLRLRLWLLLNGCSWGRALWAGLRFAGRPFLPTAFRFNLHR